MTTILWNYWELVRINSIFVNITGKESKLTHKYVIHIKQLYQDKAQA